MIPGKWAKHTQCPVWNSWKDIAENWDKFTIFYDAGKFWYEVLMAHPEMIRHAPDPFPSEYLDATRWAKVLLLHPELESKVPWDDLPAQRMNPMFSP